MDKRELINEIESGTLNKALLLLVTVLPVPLVLGVVRALQSGVWGHLLIYFSAYVVLVLTWFLRTRISNYIKTITITSIFLISGTVSLLTWGFVGVGPILFFTSLVFTILGRSERLLIFWLITVTVVISLASLNVLSENASYSLRFAEYAVAPMSWLIFGIVMLSLSAITTITLFAYQRKISELVENYVNTGDKLQENKVALQKQVNQTDLFLESLPGLFFVYNSDMQLIRWNKNHVKVTGYSNEELYLMKPEMWFEDAEFPVIENAMSQIFSKGEASAKAHMIMKDGSRVPYSFTARRIEVDGEVGFCGHGIDISEQNLLEEQMQQNQKMDALGELAGGIAHDFNNILSGFYGFLQLATIAKTDDKRSEFLGELRNLVDRAKGLVGQILSFSRREQVAKNTINLNKLIEEIKQLIGASIPSTIEKRFEVCSEEVFVMGDPTKIHQVLLNICTNGYHAMGEQGILGIKLITEELRSNSIPVIKKILKEGTYARIDISDTGKGIPLTIQSKIFEPFFTTKKSGVGTGLGLSVVHGIIADHNGSIDFKSEMGKGTVFTIYLPLTTDQTNAEDISSQVEIRTDKGEKVLFVDDERSAQIIVPTYFEELGYRIVGCVNGKDALELYHKEGGDFDIIISDQTMPVMSGVDFVKEVRKAGFTNPIILLSGRSDELLTSESVTDAGISLYLNKPIEPAELALKVKELLTA